MSGMFWIALELSIPIIDFNIMLSLTVKKLDAFKVNGVAESDNTEHSARRRKDRSYYILPLYEDLKLQSQKYLSLIHI